MTLCLLWKITYDYCNEYHSLIGVYKHPVDAHLEKEKRTKQIPKGEVDLEWYSITEEELL